MPKPRKGQKRMYPDRVKGRVFRALMDKAEGARSSYIIRKISEAIETAYIKGAIGPDAYRTLKEKIAYAEKARARQAELLNRERIPSELTLPLTEVEKLLKEHIKGADKLRKLEPWVSEQKAYADYLQGTGLQALFDVFFESAMRKLRREERKSMRNPKVAIAIKRKYNWRTFHIGMRDTIRFFGPENIYSLAKMMQRAKKAKIKILDFYPKRNHMLLHVEIPFGEKRLRELVAIERMENGRITKLGDPVKYMISAEVKEEYFKGGSWFLEHEREPETAERYERIRLALNRLLE